MIHDVKVDLRGVDVRVKVRINPRARRLQLRLDARTGHICLTLPPHVSQDQGLAFVRSKAAWIIPRRARILADQVALTHGAEIPIDGRLTPLQFGPNPQISDNRLIVREDQAARDLSALLKTRAKANLTPLAHEKAAILGLPITRLSFRDTKSRWGSMLLTGVHQGITRRTGSSRTRAH